MFSSSNSEKTNIYKQFKYNRIMNKTELVEKIAVGAELSKADAKKALEAAVEAIKTALVEGDKVQLIGFGTFSVNERPAREGMNLHTREKIQIAAKKVAKFKAGAELSDALN
ncbi:HU family DNA-binding protein [Leyella stercorea]|uniref:HU family DNA-binding protein n=2 Tax=Leyella stercorea TaxID=363265 RepID=UPI00242FADB8